MKRKRLLILLVAWSATTTTFAQLPTNGLIAHYKFNRDLSQNIDFVQDDSGYANHGTMKNGLRFTQDRHGTDCSALWFDGSGYITVPTSSSLESPQNAFTAAVWFKLADGADFFDQWITILCKSNRTTETYDTPQYRMQATAQTVSINTEFTERFIPQLSYDVWYFYAYTYDGNKFKVFLDGQFVFEFYYSGKLHPNNQPLEIGRDLPGAQEYYFGAMDDLRIYNRALSENELNKLYSDTSEAGSPNRCLPQRPPVQDSPPVVLQDPPAPQPDDTEVIATTTPPTLPDTSSTTASTTDPSTQEDEYDGLPKEINGIPIQYQRTIEVQSPDIVIYPFDNEKEDGDIVSINVNGEWVKNQYMIRKKVNDPSKKILIRCKLKPGENNYLLSKAWNLGSVGLNTLTVEINDGVSTQEVMINSEDGLSGGIKIVCPNR